MKKILLFFCVFGTLILNSQRDYNWYFGFGAGLNFSTTVPSVLNSGALSIYDNTSSISDISGNLLFYTDGQSVKNKNHAVMTNGSGLVGSNTAGQSAVIVPIPCDPNKYVIFHVTDYANPGYLSYTVVDMSLSGGLGDVIASQKNISLGSGWTEKICAYYNSVGNNYWVLVHKWNNNQFVAFNVNSNSIASSSVVTNIGSVHSCGSYGGVHDGMGQLTISPDGTKVANALTCTNQFELFNFNSVTGVLSNSIVISGATTNAWGTAFSSNSTKLYVNGLFGNALNQFDLSSFTQTAIVNSQYTVMGGSTSGYIFGYMELGPDGKVYIPRPNTTTLSVITNPNGLGAASNFSFAGQSTGTHNNSWGLSRIAYNIPSTSGMPLTISSSNSNFSICANNTLILTASGANSYTWNNSQVSSSIIVNPSVTTSYTVNCTSSGTCAFNGSSVITVYIVSAPTLNIAGPSSICAGQNATLTANGATSYTWNNSVVSNSLVILNPGSTSVYSVTGFNSSVSCNNVNSLYTLSVIPLPILSISASNSICAGQSTMLTIQGASTFTWSNGANTNTISVSPNSTTTYSVIGTNFNCNSTPALVTVSVVPLPLLSISGSSGICIGNSATLIASGATSYTWNNSSYNSFIAVSPLSTSIYTLSGDNLGCQSSITHTLVVNPNPTITVTGNTTICKLQTASLSAIGANTYSWSIGVSGSSIIVSPQIYTVYYATGINQFLCSSTKSIGVTVNSSPTIGVAGNTLVCIGQTKNFTISAAASNTCYVNGIPNGSLLIVNSTNSPSQFTITLTDTITKCSGQKIFSIKISECLGIDSQTKNSTVQIYPNPFTNSFFISTKINESFKLIDITDTYGNVVLNFEETVLVNQTEINCEQLKSGLYFLKIEGQNKEIRIVKLLKE